MISGRTSRRTWRRPSRPPRSSGSPPTATKTGVFLGVHAINPVNGEPIPVFAADYVLAEYGTGAIMAVPAHDQRDLDFARAYDAAACVMVVDTGEPDPGRDRDRDPGRRHATSTPPS